MDTLDHEQQRAGQIVPEILLRLDGLPAEVKQTAKLFADVVDQGGVDWAFTRSSEKISTTCIYLADTLIRGEEAFTQSEMADRGPGSHVTIRKYATELPRVFIEHASADQLAQLPTREDSAFLEHDLEDILRVYADASRAGIPNRAIDPSSADPAAIRDLAESVEALQTN